jgi:peptide deformylase
MSILKVARMGHPVLRTKARPVPESEITSPDVQRLVDDLTETMLEYNGVGLAAPQVHEAVRIFVAQIVTGDEDHEDGDEGGDEQVEPRIMAVINPEVTPVGSNVETDWEGCLSIPDLRGLVSRHRDIRLRGFDRHGRRIEVRASGYMARAIQHETDHLDGILFLDRMTSLESLTFLDEYARYHAQAGHAGAREAEGRADRRA